MGYDLGKRLAVLRKQVDGSFGSQVNFSRVLFGSIAGLGLLAFVIGSFETHSKKPPADATYSQEVEVWQENLQNNLNSRIAWIESIPVLSVFSDLYFSYAEAVLDTLYNQPSTEVLDGGISFQKAGFSVAQKIINGLLRIGFVFIVFWPLWILAYAIGTYIERKYLRPRPTPDILGICDPGKGPFYSGILGQLRPNHKLSGTEYSCPSLACPAMEKKQNIISHSLYQTLKKYDALNETNTGLVQTILAYKDFPSFVEEEQSAEKQSEQEMLGELAVEQELGESEAQRSFITNDLGTIEERATEILPCLLHAHRALVKFYEANKEKIESIAHLERNVTAYHKVLHKLAEGVPELTKLLLFSLTPGRSDSIVKLTPQAVASAYLSIEAGKALVYKRAGDRFTLISKYPHLQSRAVIQSLLSYHQEYDAELRLSLRQAIISSRRHGDFGRAFLPMRMPAESRALRDWLEILWAQPERRANTAYLVELDAHIDEINHRWEKELCDRFRTNLRENPTRASKKEVRAHPLWKGLAYKSVVLLPLRELLNIGLSGIHETRLERISMLLELTRKFQQSISISARLPGFKRQAIEAANGENTGTIIPLIRKQHEGEKTIVSWLIMRRMLVRFNWLSTRVGDDAVPTDGLVQAIVINRPKAEQAVVFGLDAVVPLRQRRYKVLFGSQWEHVHYSTNPHPDDISVYVEPEVYEQEIKRKQKEVELGILDKPEDLEAPVAIA